MNTKRNIIAICLMTLSAISLAAQSTGIDKLLDDVKQAYAPDKRQAVFDITYKQTEGALFLNGSTSEQVAHDAIIARLDELGVAYEDNIVVLPSDKWGQVNMSVAHVRSKPGHDEEMSTELVLGSPVRILERLDNGWSRIQCPDGYIGYMINGSMTQKTDAQMRQWRNSDRMIVTSLSQVFAYKDSESRSCRDVVTDLVNGCIVEGPLQLVGTRSQVILPDGRKAWVENDDIADLTQWAAQPFSSRQILDLAYSMMGAPYLWGGTSTKMLDCSGLAKVAYFSNGIILLRDASQQATTGTRIEASNWRTCQAGDLLFFGNAKTRRVTHVAIYDEDGFYVHSSGKVRHNSVNPKSDEYLTTPFLHAVRIAGNEGTRGITRVAQHPWFFNIDK